MSGLYDATSGIAEYLCHRESHAVSITPLLLPCASMVAEQMGQAPDTLFPTTAGAATEERHRLEE